MDYKWTKMSKPLKWPVKDGKTTLIPIGAVGVEIAFNQSSKKLFNEFGRPTSKFQNVYRWNGTIYNA